MWAWESPSNDVFRQFIGDADRKGRGMGPALTGGFDDSVVGFLLCVPVFKEAAVLLPGNVYEDAHARFEDVVHSGSDDHRGMLLAYGVVERPARAVSGACS